MPFQTTVLAEPAPGLPGGWASANPHTSMLNPNNGDPAAAPYTSWQVGATGVIVGQFGFADQLTGLVTSAHPGTGPILAGGFGQVRTGVVHRYNFATIPAYLGQSGSAMYVGQEVDIADGGDFWIKFAAGATPGQKVFVSYADGSAIAGTAGASITTTGVTATTTNGSPNLTAVAGGTLVPGQPISGTNIPANTYIVSVGSGTVVMSANATGAASGTAITQTTAVETRYWVDSLAPANGIAKVSPRG